VKKTRSDTLSRRLHFICEIDKVKSIYRHTLLMDGSRRENDAEHAWHLAIMALLFSDLSRSRRINVLKVVKMVLIHDIVEIDCGDVFLYDEKARLRQKKHEARAARRIFGLLPRNQAKELLGLWREFEEKKTAEARFAAALDRFQPVLHNYKTGGRVWKKAKIDSAKVLTINEQIGDGAPGLWEQVKWMVEDGTRKGFFGKRRVTGRSAIKSRPRQ
jgi:putative hydrolase of HD superfamily